MAGTLERVVKYDAVAFQKAWDFLASSDDEDNYLFIYFFVELFSPEREQNMAFLGATVFFAAVGPCRVMSLEKKKVSTKKTSKISKKSSPRASDTGKGSYKHNAPDLWDRGSISLKKKTNGIIFTRHEPRTASRKKNAFEEKNHV